MSELVTTISKGLLGEEFAGRKVLITGSSRGIGAAAALAFAVLGAKVALHGTKDTDALKETAAAVAKASGVQPVVTIADYQNAAEVERSVEEAAKGLGGIDVLINNAGNDDRHTLQDITPAYWDERMAVNLRHMLFSAKAVAPGMKARGGGAIINFSSISWHLGLPGLLLYETAKAGIEGMTRALARELGPDNIRVTAVVPGNVKTPRQMKWYSPEGETEIVAQQCLKSRILPEHVAALVLFLASDDGRMCTGHEYWIDAGWR
jgi:NAD(P)-dependent dehydrogenase (short-subunit alcohol dehydrogenase family)